MIKDEFNDRHHRHMAEHYIEVPWWYITLMVISFVLGLIVATAQNITFPAWEYAISVVMRFIIEHLVSLRQGRER